MPKQTVYLHYVSTHITDCLYYLHLMVFPLLNTYLRSLQSEVHYDYEYNNLMIKYFLLKQIYRLGLNDLPL